MCLEYTDFVVLFRFHVAINIPRRIANAVLDILARLRVVAPRQPLRHDVTEGSENCCSTHGQPPFVRLGFPMNPTTGPLTGVLFLLAITAIGKKEVKEGTLGANNINPMDIMAFALTIGYVSSAIDASGLIRYLTFKIVQRHGGAGHRLFILLYIAFFAMGCFFGNDPVIQMGMLLLIYMTRISSNIVHPRAWIHTQFAISNIASAIFVSSNTTNIVIAQAFKIGFAEYTANMIVPVMAAVVLLAPILLYVVFANEALIPHSINIHELPDAERVKKPISPNIPFEMLLEADEDEEPTVILLQEVMNPFLDRASAVFGVVLMFTTLIVLLALTAANLNDVPVFWATLPAGFVMLCWDVVFGWIHRHETREIARMQKFEMAKVRAERAEQAAQAEETTRDAERSAQPDIMERIEVISTTHTKEGSVKLGSSIKSEIELTAAHGGRSTSFDDSEKVEESSNPALETEISTLDEAGVRKEAARNMQDEPHEIFVADERATTSRANMLLESHTLAQITAQNNIAYENLTNSTRLIVVSTADDNSLGTRHSESDESEGGDGAKQATASEEAAQTKMDGSLKCASSSGSASDELESREVVIAAESPHEETVPPTSRQNRTTVAALLSRLWRWSQETFPQVSVVVAHLPFSLILFVFPTFILVQSLVSMGWITLLAHGWDAWVGKTGTVGAIGGMGFLSVILCNVSTLPLPAIIGFPVVTCHMYF